MMLALIAMALLGQEPDNAAPPRGAVQDAKGKAVGGVQVFLTADGRRDPDGSIPTIAQTVTDENGQFQFEVPAKSEFPISPSGTVWAYQPGMAIATGHYSRFVDQRPVTLKLLPEERREVRVITLAGAPAVGIKISPLSLLAPNFQGGKFVAVPDRLGALIAGVSDSEGRVNLPGFAREAPLNSFVVSSPVIGPQMVNAERTAGNKNAIPRIVAEPGGSLVGKVRRADGKSLAGLEITVGVKLGQSMRAIQVQVPGGPIGVGEDGSFRTPEFALMGRQYQVIVRGEGLDAVASRWVDAVGPGRSATVPDLVLEPLREVVGRVVDPKGKALALAEVIQSGDGPVRTTTRTDREGRFQLGGFRGGPALVSCRAIGYRDGGSLVSDGEATIVMTELGEAPLPSKTTGPPQAKPGVLRALSNQLINPYLDQVLKGTDERAKVQALLSLGRFDARRAVELAATGAGAESRVASILPWLAAEDSQAAAALLESLPNSDSKPRISVAIADALPSAQVAAKLSLLERALEFTQATTNQENKLYYLGEIGERFAEMGEAERAREAFAQGLTLAATLGPASRNRPYFAARLGRIDPEAAMTLLRDVPNEQERMTGIANLAVRVAATRPDLFEKVADSISETERSEACFYACAKMAPIDPAHARRIVDAETDPARRGRLGLALAYGLARESKADAVRACRKAMKDLDGPVEETPSIMAPEQMLLPIVEQIDTALIPEFTWFVVSRRPPTNPSLVAFNSRASEYRFVAILARYDREIARALFAPLLKEAKLMNAMERLSLTSHFFQAYAHLDARGCVAMIEDMQSRIDPAYVSNLDRIRVDIAEYLGRWEGHSPPPVLPHTIGFLEQLRRRDVP